MIKVESYKRLIEKIDKMIFMTDNNLVIRELLEKRDYIITLINNKESLLEEIKQITYNIEQDNEIKEKYIKEIKKIQDKEEQKNFLEIQEIKKKIKNIEEYKIAEYRRLKLYKKFYNQNQQNINKNIKLYNIKNNDFNIEAKNIKENIKIEENKIYINLDNKTRVYNYIEAENELEDYIYINLENIVEDVSLFDRKEINKILFNFMRDDNITRNVDLNIVYRIILYEKQEFEFSFGEIEKDEFLQNIEKFKELKIKKLKRNIVNSLEMYKNELMKININLKNTKKLNKNIMRELECFAYNYRRSNIFIKDNITTAIFWNIKKMFCNEKVKLLK